MLEVGVFEEGGIFEAVAQEAVEGDMADPDKGDRNQQWLMWAIGDCEQKKGHAVGVSEVVDGGASSWIDEVAEHKDVWCEEEDGEEEPAELEMVVEENDSDEEADVFELEKDGGAGEHWLDVLTLSRRGDSKVASSCWS